MKKLYSILLIFWLFILGSAQNITVPPTGITPEENYVYTREYLTETSTSNNALPQIQTVTYFDGLGRPKQTINIKASFTGKDVVTRTEYDPLGRQDKDFLPMPQSGTTQGGIYSIGSTTGTTSYSESVGNPLYGATTPFYTLKNIEKSPLERPLSSTAPGDWNVNNKKVTTEYKFNLANEVKKYTVTTNNWTENRTDGQLVFTSGNYAANQLYKNTVTDEDGNISIEFKNKLGQTVLARKILSSVKNADTYYVYNEYQDLVYVLSPLASEKNSLTDLQMSELCYQYRYDTKNRLVEKKLPGKGWEYMVYDNQDRLIMTQDANMRSEGTWLFTKYDQFGRVAFTGITVSDMQSSRSAEQISADAAGSNNVSRNPSYVIDYSGLKLFYTVAGTHPAYTNISKLLSVNYYDTYLTGDDNYQAGGTALPARPSAILTQNTLGDNILQDISTKGLPTASYVNNIEDDKWSKTYSWYDTRGRNVGTSTINHLGGSTRTESFLDFSGAVKQSFTYHKRKSTKAEVVVKEDFEYDSQNRLWKHFHEVIGKSPKTLLVENHYNEIGQIERKTVGADQYGNNPLQDINYDYNVRGWLTGINKGDILQNAAEESFELTNGKLFGYEVHYQDPRNPTLAPPKYNGNIAQVSWIDSYTSMKSYAYKYDGLNRLLSGIFLEPGLTLPETHSNDEIISYDLNGNISSLIRKTKLATKPFSVIVIDNLSYNILGGSGNSNKILSISDASGNFSGYEGGGNPMSYDANGNITAMPDKGISNISYNFLNLPRQISQHTNVTHNFYRADGVKVRKEFVLTNAAGTKTIETEYLEGFQYSTPNTEPIQRAMAEADDATLAARTAGEEEAFLSPERAIADPGGPINADNIGLSFFPTAEGYYDYENFRYIYQYKDHLGNVRVSFVGTGTGTPYVVDRNDYYPFGMSFLKSQSGNSYYDPMAIPYNYKFGGKELQETGMYDFGARMYMPDIGRWGVVDPLAETSRRWSPYTYALNNPIRFIDPDGMEAEAAASDSGAGGETGTSGFDSNGNETVEIIGGIKISAGTAAINVTHFGDGGGTNSKSNRENESTTYGSQNGDWESSNISSSEDSTEEGAERISSSSEANCGPCIKGLVQLVKIIVKAAKQTPKATKVGTTQAAKQFSKNSIDDAVKVVMKDPNKVNHLFDPKHNLDAVVSKLGGQENTVRAVLNAANGKLPASGVFKNVPVRVGGQTILIRGNVVNNTPRLGTMFIP